jgi:hypothetical protein
MMLPLDRGSRGRSCDLGMQRTLRSCSTTAMVALPEAECYCQLLLLFPGVASCY